MKAPKKPGKIARSTVLTQTSAIHGRYRARATQLKHAKNRHAGSSWQKPYSTDRNRDLNPIRSSCKALCKDEGLLPKSCQLRTMSAVDP
jgi:hypothetical protein